MKEIFKEAGKAISDFKFYREVKDFKPSKPLKYIFTLILVITLILTIRFSFDFKKGVNIAADWALQNLPPIEIQNGVASADVKQPYKIMDEDLALIIDTTGEVTSLDGYERGVLLMKDKLVYKENEVKTETYNLSDIDTLRIDENFVNAIRKNALWMIFPIILIGAFITACIAKFFQIFIFSLVSIAASTILKIKLTYKQLFNIGVYAITPSYILGALLALFGLRVPIFGVIYSGLYIAYLIVAVQRCKDAAEEIPTT
ncbi:MAG: DUF1189 domain-containing protein [Candidatus Omnitrophica bacterium]|nr:DUF1189 domain-containing protein [Candidatus Omnitrophota bacterium]